MFDTIRDWFEDQFDQDEFSWSWWYLLVVPVIVFALVGLIQRFRMMRQEYPGGYSRSFIPGTGQTGQMEQAPTRELDHKNFSKMGEDMSVPEMADFKTSHAGQSHYAAEREVDHSPQASEDSQVHPAGPHTHGQAEQELNPPQGEATQPASQVGRAGQPQPAQSPVHQAQSQPVVSHGEQTHPDQEQVNNADSEDDFRPIEGIGPSISSMLHRSGILTFDQLANTPIDRLNDILEAAGIREISDPETWSEQARLAADGKWDELTALQKTLKRGRR